MAKKGIMLIEEVGYKPIVNKKKQVGEEINDKKKDSEKKHK